MLTFHLGSARTPVVGYITHDEETLFEDLAQCRIAFINKLWDRFYDSPHFSQAEMELARRKLLALAQEMVQAPSPKRRPEHEARLSLVYKLTALTTLALMQGGNLCACSD